MPKLNGSKEPYKYQGGLKENLVTSQELQVTSKREFIDCSSETGYQIPNTKNPETNNLFRCGVGLSNLVINPFGELKMCIHIDYPKYNILETSLRQCWERLKQVVDSIKLGENYKCDRCELEPYCKWCPARAWNQDNSFASCDPECKRRAEHNYIMTP